MDWVCAASEDLEVRSSRSAMFSVPVGVMKRIGLSMKKSALMLKKA